MRELDRKLLRDLLHMRGQVIAVGLVVACGVAVFVSMLSVYASLQLTRDEYYERNRFAAVFASFQRAPLSMVRSLAAIEGVASVEDRIVKDVACDVPGLDEPATVRLVSVPESNRPRHNDLYIRVGRWIEPGAPDEVIVSEAFAQANGLLPGDSLGAIVGGHWRSLRIVGIALSPEYIYELQPNAAVFADNKRFGVLWMGRSAMNARFGMTGAFNDVVIGLERGAESRGVTLAVDALLADYGCAQAYARKDQISAVMIDEELKQLRANAIYLPVILMAIAAFLLNIVLIRLIALQRDQIAVLKAFGYSNRSIGAHYMKMCLGIVLVGSVFGIAVGAWVGVELTEVYTYFYHFPFLRYRLGGDVVAAAIGISAASAAAGAIGAVRRVVAMPPAEAMRPAAPGRFKPGILERMGFEAMMSSSARMVVRSLERYPWKAVISVIGIGVAVGILMVGNFAADSIEYMADVQFRAIQREDVVAVFTTPLATDAIASLASLPGVLRVEPYRVLPARIHSGSRSRTVAIQGVDERAELRRIVDEDMIAHRPASEGLTMTTMLGTVLGVGVGDTVLVEVLEGRRRIRYVPVVALVDEVLGLQAYMCRSAVDRLAGGSAISGAYLLVDEAQRDELYHRLKRTPAIAGATIREVTIEGFYQTIGESQNIARLVVTVAAVVIAIGIVYNNARIALSERGRELASLRVLGFTRPEVTRLLLGEQAILTVLGLPLGYAFGFAFTMLISQAYEAEMYRLPIIVTGSSFAYSTIVVIVAAALSGLLVRRRLRNLDLIEVLKTRE